MAGLIPQSFIDDLLDRLDIVDVVDSRVKLKKTGKNYSACCPFHDEKTPSFTVSPEKQFFYCFGCGASGNALGFIMDYERLSFPEATESLARLAGLEVPREVQTEAQQKREEEKRSIYTLLEKADLFYQQQLRHHPSKHLAVNYLKNRGLDGKTAKAYGVGFAPPGWDNLLKSLAQNDDDKHLLIEGGMLIHQEQEKKLYDRFRHRIMFPIRDTRGRVIGFGGRVLGDDKPKYLNSPETPVFHKGQELYGLYEARLAYRELPRLLVVEGYMDVVSLAQFGIHYGVATLGTACGPDHLDRAFKYTNEVVFCFDGDKAGRSAAHRALEASIECMTDGRTVKFLFLPENEDPDTLVRQIGPEKFERMIELAVPFEDYLFDAVADGLNIRTMEGRATFSKRAAPLLDRLPKGVFRELMFESLATRTGLSRNVLQDLVLEQHTKEAQPQPLQTKTSAEEKAPQVALPRQADSWWDHQAQGHQQNPYDTGMHPGDYGDFPAELPPPEYENFYAHHRTTSKPLDAAIPPLDRKRHINTPFKLALALLLKHPYLANLEPDHTYWLSQDDENSRLLGDILKTIHERPHYNTDGQIMFHWAGLYGSEQAKLLALMADHPLLDDLASKKEKIMYDAQIEFQKAIAGLKKQDIQKSSSTALEKLKSTNFTQLSKEEREQLVRAALATKLQP
ncbi:DNA primase [Cellvibrio sp. KY-GH-1]|uniref:DNA primase n=1 Tax=Cellvibrio sp. KY-GH-1 TaxID=2303332 RepID=UPI0012467622|nr:DNA primase [Cellvibrio sp. KY-GH-1]QEY16672.1 DNA primase [Cellvibrio sp. KY-GH-1]